MDSLDDIQKFLLELNLKYNHLKKKKIFLMKTNRVCTILTILFFPALFILLTLGLILDDSIYFLMFSLAGLIIMFVISLFLGNESQKKLNLLRQTEKTFFNDFKNTHEKNWTKFEMFEKSMAIEPKHIKNEDVIEKLLLVSESPKTIKKYLDSKK